MSTRTPTRSDGAGATTSSPEFTLGEWLSSAARAAPPERGVQVEGERLSWAELDEGATRLAAGLLNLGVQPGERVCVLMQASIDSLLVWFALARAGVVEVPLNPSSGQVLLQFYLEQSKACAVVCDADLAGVVRELTSGLAGVRHIVVCPDRTEPGAQHGHSLTRLRVANPIPMPSVSATDPAVVLYTSGTTGPPKGAVLSHRANVNLARHTVDLMGYRADDRLFSVFPLYHSNARYCSVMAAAQAGADLLMHRRFSASNFWDICRAEGITAFNYQGAMMSILHKRPERPDDADNPVRVAFGAPCPKEIFADVERRFDIQLTEIYGSTETSIICDMPPHRRRIGTAGQESVNYEVAIVDERDERVPTGTAGEIVTRPKHPGWMFEGYHDNAAATVAGWRNLWFHTGDRGVLDQDGYLTFLDRMKDTIRRRGENISSWEIERVVGRIEGVAAVAAYGVPSQLSEEEVMLAVVPAPGVQLDPAGIVAHCSSRLTGFAIPRYIRIMDALPLTSSQRVEKYRLRADARTANTWDREAP